jgi:hypothetical protein
MKDYYARMLGVLKRALMHEARAIERDQRRRTKLRRRIKGPKRPCRSRTPSGDGPEGPFGLVADRASCQSPDPAPRPDEAPPPHEARDVARGGDDADAVEDELGGEEKSVHGSEPF